MIDSASNFSHRVMLMILYSTGVRRSELVHLKVDDIDSKRMVIHVRQGKGSKDRDVPLSPKLLETLREYWRSAKPKTYLFPGQSGEDVPLTTKAVWHACQGAVRRAGIAKKVSPHCLRHASAYYTTFQSPFILKTIALVRARSAGAYGRRAGPRSPLPAPPAATSLFSR